jgi:hypothetical protein
LLANTEIYFRLHCSSGFELKTSYSAHPFSL